MISSNDISEGIIISWKLDIDQLDFINTNRQVAFGTISSSIGQSWIMAFIYASTCGIERRVLYDQILSVNSLNLPLFVIGDFNCILNRENEKGGKHYQVTRDIREFRNCNSMSTLIDIGISDPPYT